MSNTLYARVESARIQYVGNDDPGPTLQPSQVVGIGPGFTYAWSICAVAWIRVDDHFDEHNKFQQVGPLGIALWLAGLAYCNRNLTDGHIPWAKARSLLSWDFLGPDQEPMTIAITSGMKGDDVKPAFVIRLLVDAGLWEEVDGGYRVHDYNDYQFTKEQIEQKREATTKRVAEWRERNSVTNDVTNNDVTPEVTALVRSEPKTQNPKPNIPIPNPKTSNVNGLPAVSRKKPRDNPPVTNEVWAAYSEAYEDRYHVKPIRNKTVNGQMANFIGRVGSEEAPRIAAWFLLHNHARYVNAGHTIGILLMDAEKLRTEWANGHRTTNHAANEADRLQGTGDMWQELKEEFRNARTVRQLD